MSKSEVKESSVDNLTQVQRDCITILSIYKNSIEKSNYEQIKDTIASQHGMDLLLTFQHSDWKISLCNNIASIAMYRQFKNVEPKWKSHLAKNDSKDKKTETQNKENKEIKEKETKVDPEYVNCRENIRVYQASLPINWDKEKGRKNTNPIHLKMSWKVGPNRNIKHIAYNLEFRGHLYCASQVIYSIAVGYVDPIKKTFSRPNVIHLAPGLQEIEAYFSKDEHVCFKIVSKDNSDWHASDLVVQFIGASDCYHRNAVNKGVKVIEAINSKEKF